MAKNGTAAKDTAKASSINLRVLAACALFASKDEARYYLNGVCIEIDERGTTYVGTDGHRLIAYRDERTPDEDDNRLLGTFIIPTAHCKHHKIDKDGPSHGAIFGTGRLTIAYEMVDVTFMPIDGEFPDWRKTIPPQRPSGLVAQFNLKYVADLHKFSKSLDIGSPFIAHNGEAPAFVWFASHPHIVGVMMPIKLTDEMQREAPQWARRGPQREQADIEDDLPPTADIPRTDTSDRPFGIPESPDLPAELRRA